MNPMQQSLLKAWTLCSLLVATSALAAGVGGIPASSSVNLSAVPVQSFPALDREALMAEDEIDRAEGGPARFAVARDVELTPDSSGRWEDLGQGRSLWRLRLSCPEVLSLNLGFHEFRLPASGQLLVYAADGSGPVFHFDANDHRSSGELWTPVLLTDDLVVELQIDTVDRDQAALMLGRVGCGYRFFGDPDADKSGSCNIDTVCDEGDDWRHEISAVGMYSVNGVQRCTGVMVNNTAEDERPLFLTANHCPVDAASASSVVVYWNYESPNCGDLGGGSLEQFTSGSSLLASDATSDFKLLELDESPDPVFSVAYAGWDRSGDVPDEAVCIHHPSTDEKAISFEDDPLTITSYTSNISPGNGTHLRVEDWDLGTTEGGSSGSPLFDSNHRIVGQLHGGYAACGNDLSDWYGRLSVSWSGGGTAESRLRDYLDPLNTGTMILNRLNGPDIPDPDPDPNPDITLLSVAPNPFSAEAEVTYRMSDDGQVHARILDVAGRSVRDLGHISADQGENTLTWNGLTEGGRKAPSGLYLIYLEAGEHWARGQVIFLK